MAYGKGTKCSLTNYLIIGLLPWLEIQFFYNELLSNMKMIIDAAAGEALMSQNLEEAYELLDEMSSNNYQ